MTTVADPRGLGTSRWLHLLQLVSVTALTVLLLSFMSASETVDGGAWRKLFMLLRIAFLVLLCTWFLRWDGERWSDLGFRRPRRLWTVPLLVVGGFVVALVLNEVLRATVLPAVGALPPQFASSEARAGNLPDFLFALLSTWTSAAFGEELLLRGFVLDRIAKLIRALGTATLPIAIVAQAAMFGSFHFYQGLGGVLITGMLGLVMGVLWLIGGRNLWPCILLHGLINTISAIEAYTWTPG